MKTLKKRSFKQQIVLVVILSTIVPLLLLSVFSILFVSQSAKISMDSRLNEVLKSSNDLVGNLIKQQLVGVEVLGDSIMYLFKDNDADVEGLESNINTLIYQYLLSGRSTQDMYFILPDGNYVGTSDLPNSYNYSTYKNWGVFREAGSKKVPILYQSTHESIYDNQISYSIAYEISDQENLYGYLILDVSTEAVQNVLNTVKGTSFGYIQFVLTSKGNRVIYNDSSFRSPISYLQNIFSFDRYFPENDKDVTLKLDQMIISQITNEEIGITFYGLVPMDMIRDQSTYLLFGLIVFIVFVALITTFFTYRSTNKLTQPLLDLVYEMKNYRRNPHVEALTTHKFDNELQELSYQFIFLKERIEELISTNEQKQELLRITEIKALMAQLNPHFLNNTLDSIKWKAKLSGSDDIAMMVTSLSTLLKVSMDQRPFVSVEEELRLIKSYLTIQGERYGDKLSYMFDVDDLLMSLMIPKLILQPIVENAIIHGIEPLNRQGLITIKGYVQNDFVVFVIIDNGVGSDYDINYGSLLDQTKIGTKNVDSRLKLHYGQDYGIEWLSALGKGTQVTIRIPISKGAI